METGSAEPDGFAGTDGRRVVAVFALLVLIVGGFFASRLVREFAGGGMAEMSVRATASSATVHAMGVDAFALRLASPATFVVNVETGGRLISGTDASVAYDALVGDSRLPRDLNTPVALYSKTGWMSTQAAAALSEVGYRHVAYLAGGTDAWAAAGKGLE